MRWKRMQWLTTEIKSRWYRPTMWKIHKKYCKNYMEISQYNENRAKG